MSKEIRKFVCQRPKCNTIFEKEIKRYKGHNQSDGRESKHKNITNPVLCPNCGTYQRIKEGVIQ